MSSRTLTSPIGLVRLFAALVAAGGSACNTGDGGASDTACEERATVDDCCCFRKSGDEASASVATVCTPAAEPCGEPTLQCGEDDGPCSAVDDEAALDCVLSALTAEEPATVRVRFDAQDNPGYWGRTIEYHVVGDGTVYRVDREFLDLTGAYLDIGRYSLQAPAYFDDCLAATVGDKADCVRRAPVAPAAEICVPTFSFYNF